METLKAWGLGALCLNSRSAAFFNYRKRACVCARARRRVSHIVRVCVRLCTRACLCVRACACTYQGEKLRAA
jgi:hypothetical protein